MQAASIIYRTRLSKRPVQKLHGGFGSLNVHGSNYGGKRRENVASVFFNTLLGRIDPKGPHSKKVEVKCSCYAPL